MRSSKSRSRSKTNRPRPIGNIVNRVFDSSGPEGKVRGTPQQVIEKYLFLARDAQLSNDRVAAENFNQHAEHYTRMLAEAQRELAAEQEARQSQQQQRDQQQRDQQPRDRQPREDRGEHRPDFRSGQRPDSRDDRSGDQPYVGQAEVIDLSQTTTDDTGLVETPESRHRAPPRQQFDGDAPAAAAPKGAPRPRRDAGLKAAAVAATDTASAETGSGKDETAPRKPRPPRKPRSAKPCSDDDKPAPDGSREAAE
ncbi:MAG: DUF4167 domain-containing protein [Pseudorhodobacter sp.]|nr:DUF4167 domain-containing protein [Pseudorhodobacter sp.]